MAGRKRSYSIRNIFVSFGNIPISGFGDGTTASISQSEDDFTYSEGNDGEGVVSAQNREYTEVTLTLKYGSRGLAQLMQFNRLDRTTGVVGRPLSIRDANGGCTITSPDAFIKKRSDIELAREAGDNEVVICCPTCDIVYGELQTL